MDIGTRIAYKHGAHPRARSPEKEKIMATKKARKSTKKLKKEKKLAATKPLFSFGASNPHS